MSNEKEPSTPRGFDCEHERLSKDQLSCLDCYMIFALCPGCSESGGADMPIFHEPPVCKTSAEREELRALGRAGLDVKP